MSSEDEHGGISFAAEAEEINEQLHQSFKEGNDMLQLAIKGQWNNVLRIYERNSSARENSLHSEDTVLHIAVSDGREDTVQKLLNISDGFSVMHKKNNKGNTPLHLAAAMGNVAICKCLAPKAPELIADRNNAGETPLFLAAHHGKREAFLFLHELHTRRRGGVPDYSSCEKSDETSILHSAIYGKYFDLAFEIVSEYPKLVISIDKNGLSPLHILATKPNAFKSGTHLGLFDAVIYKSIIMDKLKKKTSYREMFIRSLRSILQLLRSLLLRVSSLVNSLLGCCKKKPGKLNDEEARPQPKSDAAQGVAQSEDHHKDNSSAAAHLRKKKKWARLAVSFGLSFINLVMKPLVLILLALGTPRVNKIRAKKEMHTSAIEVMQEMVKLLRIYGKNDMIGIRDLYGDKLKGVQTRLARFIMHGEEDIYTWHDHNAMDAALKRKLQDLSGRETPLLIATKMGVTEMVERILEVIPEAIQGLDSNKRNAVLLAIEYRQTNVYSLLLNFVQERRILMESPFRQLDSQGNSALHLAAMFGNHRPWLIPGDALHMQWEIKWYKFVKNSMPPHYFARFNNMNESPKEIFQDKHQALVNKGSDWLTKTSQSFSVVAALIVTVVFPTQANVPGSFKEGNGAPNLEDEPGFKVYAIASIFALCFSVTSLVVFLAIPNSRYRVKDFEKKLPVKLLLGLTSLFASIGSMLISFCAGTYFILRDEMKVALFPIYAVACFPVTIFALQNIPLYVNLIWAIFQRVPHRALSEPYHYMALAPAAAPAAAPAPAPANESIDKQSKQKQPRSHFGIAPSTWEKIANLF